MNEFLQKVMARELTVGVIGLGYVGIPLAISITRAGFKTLGFDIVPDRVDKLNGGESPVKHIGDSEIGEIRENGFSATTDFSLSKKCDVLIICVPTPLNRSREPDLSFVTSTMETILPYMRAGQMLSLESTTWPGTTKEVLLPYVEKAGLTVGTDFYLVYSPEREDPGNLKFSTQTIPKVVGGLTKNCLEVGASLYGTFVDTVVRVSSPEAAEMVKLLENIHRAVNIGLVNEMKIVADAMGLDIFEIIDAAKTKPFGFTAYYPGPGIGGHCIPIDPFYLTWKAREYGIDTKFIEIAGEINSSMPGFVVQKAVVAMNKIGKTLNGAKVLVLGLAYKKDIDDVRESPSVFIMELLREWGSQVDYSDPYVTSFPKMREHKFELKSIELTEEVVASYDLVILLTDHSDFDYEMIGKNAPLLIDTRGIFPRNMKSVVRA